MQVLTLNLAASTLMLRLEATRRERRRLEAEEIELFHQLPEGEWSEADDDSLNLGRVFGQSLSAIAERVSKHPAQVVKRTLTLRALGKLSNPYNHGSKWTPGASARLVELYDSGASISQCAAFLGRTDNSIRAQLAQLGRAVAPCW